MRRKLWASLALFMSLALAASSVASAHDRLGDDGVVDSGLEIHGTAHDQHGGDAGHLPATSSNVRLVSKLRVTNGEGRISDVGVWKGFAYLGGFRQDSCTNPENTIDGGVYIVDIRNPAAPKQVGFLQVAQDSFVGEGVQALTVTTPKFNGDLLVLNSEACDKNNKGGFTLYDVTNPLKPSKLVSNFGDFNVSLDETGKDANDIHSAYAWDAGSKAYLVSVDDLETTDVDIYDITDPSHPAMVGEYDLNAQFPQIIQADLGSGSSFFHDVVVREFSGRQIMLLSYWDGGYVLLDVTDPAHASYVADSDFTNPDPQVLESTGTSTPPEGNAHEAEFTRNGDFVVAADEDFGPYALRGLNTSDGTSFQSTSGSDTPQLTAGQTLTGQTKFVGRACPGDAAVPAGNGSQIALVERGLCLFTEKLGSVEAAGGYKAIIVFNRTGADGCSGLLTMSIEGSIPAFFVNRATGFDFLDLPGYNEDACRAAAAGSGRVPDSLIGTVGDNVSFSSTFDGWGYVHLYRNDVNPNDGSNKLRELDTWALPEAMDPAKASGFGDLSVHEAATSLTRNNLVYLSHYAGGFRVLKITNRNKLEEVGRFIDEGGNNFWGVQVFAYGTHEYVAASDRDSGIYIFEYTGP
jgi:hypothetical protein